MTYKFPGIIFTSSYDDSNGFCMDEIRMKINELGQKPVSPGNLNTEEIGEYSKLCKALGHPVRVKMMQLFLSEGGWVCGQLVDKFPLAQSTVSEHLRILLAVGLINKEIYPGKGRKYCVNDEALKKFKVLTAKL